MIAEKESPGFIRGENVNKIDLDAVFGKVKKFVARMLNLVC